MQSKTKECEAKAKHTPGPWGAKQYPDGSWGVRNFLFAICNIRNAFRFLVSIVEQDMTNERPEERANAHLIAAAPDLLEALQNIENDDGRIPKAIWDMRNAAISKALPKQAQDE